MQDVTLKSGKRVLAIAVALVTMAWSIGLATLVAPLSAQAVTFASGSLIKGSLAAVYYYGADGKRYVFPNEKTYLSWFSDFSGVIHITDAELATIMIGGNVTYRPGAWMIKIQSDPKVYAVSHNGTLRPIASEAIAACLYGAAWGTHVQDLSDAFFTNYHMGATINACGDYSVSAELAAATSINADKDLTGQVVSGSFTVSLNSGTPASASVPRGATAVPFVKFDIHNGGSSAMTVDSITVHRKGPGAPGDFSAVYLYEGDTRLTSSRSVNTSSNEANFTSVNITLAAGQTRTLWVAADISTTAGAGNVNAFEVTKVFSGTVSAVGVPVVGNDMTITSATVGTVTISRSGSITNPKVGQLNAKVAEFQLAAGSSEDLEIRRVTLFQGGNLSASNLTNLHLKYAGSDVAVTSGVDSKDHIVLVFSTPLILEKGNSKTFMLYADIGGGARANDTIRLYTEEMSDVWAVGRTYGYGATVTNTAYDNGSNDGSDASWSVVEGGQITISFNGPASKDVPTNGKDIELFNFTMASQSNVEVRRITLELDTTSGFLDNDVTPFYTDVKIVDSVTGSVVAGPKDVPVVAGGNTNAVLVFNDVFNLNAGTSRTFKVTADIASITTPDETIRVKLDAFGGSDIRNLDNSTFVATTDIVPSSAIVGNVHTVRAPSLTVSAASTPVAQSYVQGSQGVEIGAFNFKAGNSQDIRITGITLTGFVDAYQNNGVTSNADILQGCDADADADGGGPHVAETKLMTDILLTAKLWNGTTQVGQDKSPTSSPAGCTAQTGGLLQYTNLDLLVGKGQTLTLKLTGNLASSIALLGDKIRFNVVAASDVTAQDPDGNSVTALDIDGGAFTSVPSAVMTITANGTMTYVRAPSDVESEDGIVVAGSSNVVLAKYRFTAANEDLKLDKVRMQVDATVGGAVASIVNMSLYDGSTLIAGPVALNSSGAADFSNFAFVVLKDQSKTLTVKATLNTMSAGANKLGADLMVTLCNGDDTGTDSGVCGAGGAEAGSYEVRGNSAGSSTIDTGGDSGDVAGYSKIIRKTKPTVTMASLPSSTLSNGTKVISRFTITADSAEQVSVKHIGFTSSINGAVTLATSGADSNIREVGQSANIAGTVAYTTCAGPAVCIIDVEFTSEQVVAAGTSKTYELRSNVTGVGTAGDSISTQLTGDTGDVTGELEGTAPLTQIDDLDADNDATAFYNFIWSDNSNVPHNDVKDATPSNDASPATSDAAASDDWTNGRFVKVLPSDTQSMTF